MVSLAITNVVHFYLLAYTNFWQKQLWPGTKKNILEQFVGSLFYLEANTSYGMDQFQRISYLAVLANSKFISAKWKLFTLGKLIVCDGRIAAYKRDILQHTVILLQFIGIT